MNYEVKRVGKCIECYQDVVSYLGNYEAKTEQEAIDEAIKDWIYEQFGEGGALREDGVMKEEKFLNAKFIVTELKEDK